MAILLSEEIKNTLESELKNAISSVQIITAYCKESTFKYLNPLINNDVKDKRIMIRFRLDDLIKGSTDFAVVKASMAAGWETYIRFDLHAKTYIFDNKRGIIGSANATNSGLNMRKGSNCEIATLADLENQDMEKVNNLYRDAIKLDDELLSELEKQYAEIETKGDCGHKYSWSKKITELFNPKIDTLFSHELPEKNGFENGEWIGFLDMEFREDNFESIKSALRWSNAYIWLLDCLAENDGCMYFGALSSALHGVLVSDPKPFRKDVKEWLANLLGLIELLGMDEILIDRPNYSQRVRLVRK